MAGSSNQLQLGEAARAAGRLLADPRDGASIRRLATAIQGPCRTRLVAQLRADPLGRRLLDQRPRIRDLLEDRTWLRALPAHSLGRAYLEFCDAEGLGGQLRDSMEAPRAAKAPVHVPLSRDERFIDRWLRDTHDLVHVVTGYRTDYLGELGVLVFTYVHTRSPVLVPLGLIAYVRSATTRPWLATRIVARALRDARRARSLVVQDWPRMLEQPVDTVRRRLAIRAAPRYAPKYGREGQRSSSTSTP